MTTEVSSNSNNSNKFEQLALSHLLAEEQPNGLSPRFIHNLVSLLDEGATVPFIARYRKELTGAMDEVVIGRLKERYDFFCELEARKKTILDSIEEQGKLTPELEAQIAQCRDRNVLEDIYLPYKPKRKTKASIAREQGLEPLAQEVFAAGGALTDLATHAQAFIDPEKGVETIMGALTGAGHIIAEWVNETVEVRTALRQHLNNSGEIIVAKADRDQANPTKFEMYYDFHESIATIPSHRYLAIRRGEEEGVLRFNIEGDLLQMKSILHEKFIPHRDGESASYLNSCLEDALDRLLLPSLATEVRLEVKRRAEAEAIAVFAQNLRQVLLAPPAGERNVLGLDPGYRTGCKVAIIDETGKLLTHSTVYPHAPQERYQEAKQDLAQWCRQYKVATIAVGNGTASRETMQLAREVAEFVGCSAVLVNESGASIYSASEVARSEFPDLDLTMRSAVSIARRLQDPLAELVKIDPKSIGVGQYQHDVDQTALKKSLDSVVESCVNYVGVDLNTASETLLKYVSGIGPSVAKEIVRYRDANGRFRDRGELMKVPRIGAKTFELSAGFLRIRDGANPLDNTAVHPESYSVVERMAKELSVPVKEMLGNQRLVETLKLDAFVDAQTGLFTLNDIMGELQKPGRDPRSEFVAITFAEGINAIEDLAVGMVLEGVITNVTNFGAFVDIGVHQDGLVHISHLSNRFVKSPMDVVKVGERVRVRVMEVDAVRKRIALSIKDAGGRSQGLPAKDEAVVKLEPTKAGSDKARDAKSQDAKSGQRIDGKKPMAKQPEVKRASEQGKSDQKKTEAGQSLADQLKNAWGRNRLR